MIEKVSGLKHAAETLLLSLTVDSIALNEFFFKENICILCVCLLYHAYMYIHVFVI